VDLLQSINGHEDCRELMDYNRDLITVCHSHVLAQWAATTVQLLLNIIPVTSLNAQYTGQG
jgi:hypothetical protein